MTTDLLSPTKSIQSALLVVAFCLININNATATDDDLQTVTQNLRQTLLQSKVQHPGMSKTAEDWLTVMQSDGSWADEDYTDTNREHWKAIEHLPRLISILKTYYGKGTPLGGQSQVLKRCLTSLGYWLHKDPHNVNWWHNEIGVPQQIGEILVLLGADAPENLKNAGTELMKRADWKHQTGANLTDETRIQVMRGCVTGSVDLVAQGYERTWQEVRLAGENEDGMQADHSFHQHGPLLYCHGYGTVFSDDIIQFVNYAKGTSFQMPAAKQQLFNDYLLNGPQWMVRGETWDFGACGRGIVRAGSIHGSSLNQLQTMSQFTGPDQQAIQISIAGHGTTAPVGNRQYWLSDYMAQRRNSYFASVRMYSNRTLDTDGLTNGENRKTHHIADGATCLMVHGDEYFNIFPVWDWLKIPGTTVEQNTPLEPNLVSHKGKAGFVGEVSNGIDGCAAMDLISGPLQASKAWFCFDREMVCLGAGINCKSDNPVFTTVNQCNLNGTADTSDAIGGGSAPAWVWHDSIGYIFPLPTRLDLTRQAQTGRWSDIGTGSDDLVHQKVFNLWIDHGSNPSESSYQYVILPGAGRDQTAAEFANLPVKVIENSPSLQAVVHTQQHQVEAIFHQPGNLSADGSNLAVDQPCLLMVWRADNKIRVALSNPQNAALEVNVTVNGTSMHFNLPGGLMAGSTVIHDLGQRT